LWLEEIGSRDPRLERLLCELSLQTSLFILLITALFSQLPKASGNTPERHLLPVSSARAMWYVGSFLTNMAYVIAEPCIGTKDTACVDACPVDCIHPKKDAAKFADAEMLYIDPVECIDCGACVPVCPVSAIFALDDLPEKWTEFTKTNADFFGR
jgi:ferredoxin